MFIYAEFYRINMLLKEGNLNISRHYALSYSRCTFFRAASERTLTEKTRIYPFIHTNVSLVSFKVIYWMLWNSQFLIFSLFHVCA